MRKEYTRVHWTSEMEQFIRDNYKNMMDKEIADVLKISTSNVKNKRNKMGLSKGKEVPKDIINYGVEAVKGGMTYKAAAEYCYKKFGVKFNISTLINHCEVAGVTSPKAMNDSNIVSRDLARYIQLKKYNIRLNAIKNNVKVGDKILTRSGRVKIVVQKYPSFVVCMNRSSKESIQYTQIKGIVRRQYMEQDILSIIDDAEMTDEEKLDAIREYLEF